MSAGVASALTTAWRFDRLFARGQKLARAGNTAEAEDLLRAAASLKPQDPHVRLHLALCLAERGRYKEALAETVRLTSRHPQNAVFHLFHGRILFDSGAHEEALQSFEQACRLTPDNSLARGYLLLSRMALGELRGALNELRAVGIPGNPDYQARLILLLEKQAPAKPSSEGAGRIRELEEKPQEQKSAKQRMRKAQHLAEKFRFAEAADEAWEALRLCPHSQEERIYYAAFSVLARRYRAAAEALNNADLSDPEVAMWLGCAVVGLGQINEGLRLLETADNRWPETRYFRGLALLARNKTAEARREFAAAVELDWTLAHRRVDEALQALSS